MNDVINNAGIPRRILNEICGKNLLMLCESPSNGTKMIQML